MSLQAAIDRCVASTPGVEWSVQILRDGTAVASYERERVLATASIGKVFLLLRTAELIMTGELDPLERLSPLEDERVADSGLWQHLDEPSLSVSSLAVLVASVSDNLATNVLLRRLGLESVHRMSSELGMPETAMLDRIRDVRGPGDPRWPSVGRAADLADLMQRIAADRALGRADSLVRSWLSVGVDLSMVASALALDPLSHGEDDMSFFNKTGTDAGCRADAGSFVLPSGVWAYAVLANWQPAATGLARPVVEAMRGIGAAVIAAP